jgi:hypothetical protein
LLAALTLHFLDDRIMKRGFEVVQVSLERFRKYLTHCPIDAVM